MTRKIFRKLLIAFAALFLFLVNVPANAYTPCELACYNDYGACMSQVGYCWGYCGGIPSCFEQCYYQISYSCQLNLSICFDYCE